MCIRDSLGNDMADSCLQACTACRNWPFFTDRGNTAVVDQSWTVQELIQCLKLGDVVELRPQSCRDRDVIAVQPIGKQNKFMSVEWGRRIKWRVKNVQIGNLRWLPSGQGWRSLNEPCLCCVSMLAKISTLPFPKYITLFRVSTCLLYTSRCV